MKARLSRIFHFLLLAVLIAGCQPDTKQLESARFAIDSIQSQWIPDSRVALFSIKASSVDGRIQLHGKATEGDAVEALLAALTRQHIPFTDSILLLPDSNLGDRTWGLITLSVANIRYNPSQSAEMATQALMGTPVRILQEENGYYLIQTPDRYISWTESAGVALKSADDMERWKTAGRLLFTGDFALIYSLPSELSDPVSDLVSGGILEADLSLKPSSGFLPVVLPDGRKGYLRGNQCRDLKDWSGRASVSGGQIVSTARQYLGRPYLWGGTSPKAFDCSGFTKTVYFLNGYILSRDASQQVNEGVLINREFRPEELQPGDLLFFGRKATPEKPERATHVGLFLDDSRFIHCSGLVKINSLDPASADFRRYYIDNLLQIKRLLSDTDQPQKISDHPWYF
ncbi:MAG: C40 family peptidase [Bacteroidales bacterium]